MAVGEQFLGGQGRISRPQEARAGTHTEHRSLVASDTAPSCCQPVRPDIQSCFWWKFPGYRVSRMKEVMICIKPGGWALFFAGTALPASLVTACPSWTSVEQKSFLSACLATVVQVTNPRGNRIGMLRVAGSHLEKTRGPEKQGHVYFRIISATILGDLFRSSAV